MGGVIRDARREDLPGIQHVVRTTWDYAYRETIPEEVRKGFVERAYSRASLERRIGDDVFLVAIVDEEILGFADFRLASPDEVELAAIYVLPEAQGSGLGTRLLETGIRGFPSATKITLHVERENASARHFYERRGFVVDRHHTEILLGHELRLVEMTLNVGETPTG